MNNIKHNNELYQCFNSENKFNFYYDKKIENLIGNMQLVTNPGKVQTWLGIKKNSQIDFVWIKVTNSYEEDINSYCFHQYKGFYISVITLQNTLLIQYNDPISNDDLNKVINFFNKIEYIKHFNYIINIVEKILKRKSDFLDYN